MSVNKQEKKKNHTWKHTLAQNDMSNMLFWVFVVIKKITPEKTH